MKNFLKHFLTKINILLIAIFVIAAFVRFYNFPNRVTFWSEQARSLIVSANYIKEKPSLLGQPYFIREDINSHILYSGAYFNYLLVPLLLITNYEPVAITSFFTLLNLFTGFLIYLLVKKMYGKDLALVSTFLFLFNDWMIYHSLFIWSYNFLPLVGLLALYFFWRFFKKHKPGDMFIMGLVNGLGISLQFLFLPITLLVFIVTFLKSKKKIADTFLFGLGIALGNLPVVIFDARHNFYETRTLLQYFLDTLGGRSNAAFAYYYLLPFWPLFAIGGALLLLKIIKWNKLSGFSILLVYILLNLASSRVNFTSPAGMPTGIKVSDVDRTSKIIAADAHGEFNVAEVLDFDKQAYVLRYFTEFRYGKKALGVTDYPNLKLLYVLAQKEYNFGTSDVWEINSGGKYKISKLTDMDGNYAVYKLAK